ncbi:aldose epimerase family protein [Streptomyces sp. SP18CS02]|uniref:aldose epimerase family protein n=1 Tax=Streptomyces sp. SP18CS02 TaxID=3002531 RepID=UPI002E7A4AD0|nr:aldose epimerase family protein [Streptomyces sp. SP18CS02]MEE1753339.1 galactose mutarotase [Streptomyces sp. SP18CS02]
MKVEECGSLADGTTVHRWLLERAGTRVRLLTYGGIVQSVEIPDRNGDTAEVVLGFDSPAGYEADPDPYYGALVGRYANRIGNGTFVLDGRTHHLARNGGTNSLHGGERGFDKRVWDAQEVEDGVRLSRVSPDGEEGFPGRLEVSATYSLDGTGALLIAYEAVTDAPTVVGLTNHSYWNLGGAHELWIAAGHYTPLDETQVPTGEIAPVDGTWLDHRTPREVVVGRLDHNFVLDRNDGPAGQDGPAGAGEPVAELYSPVSGRVLTVSTSEPGLQVYAPGHLDGVALETQHFPDSPNRPRFPSTVLRPGEVYRSWTRYGFGVR